MSAQQFAVKILGPVVESVVDWLEAREKPGTLRPAVLATLPNELQAEIALIRLKARHELQHELTHEEKLSIGVVPPAPLEAPNQESRLTATLGPVPDPPVES